MTPFAHIAAGYLSVYFAGIISPESGFDSYSVVLTGIVAANLPDLDFIFVKDKNNHRNTITHAPLFWLPLIVVGFFVSGYLGKNLFLYVTAFSLGIFSHFLLDWFAAREKGIGGVRLFYPFSKKHYGFLPLTEPEIKFSSLMTFPWKKYLSYYASNKILFFAELIIIFSGLLMFLLKAF